jgi:hypothetical protein
VLGDGVAVARSEVERLEDEQGERALEGIGPWRHRYLAVYASNSIPRISCIENYAYVGWRGQATLSGEFDAQNARILST